MNNSLKHNSRLLSPQGLSALRRPCVYVMMCLLLFVGIKTQAQQTPVFSSYYFNKFIVNPAFTGIDNDYRAFGFFRTQWGAMPGRPISGGATVEGSFWKDRIGAGIFVMNDRIGIFNQTNVSFAYAQKIKFAKEHQISIGIQGSAFINQIDFSSTLATDFNDPSLADPKPMKAVFDFNLGISYKWKNLLLGFSVPQVLQPNAKFANGSTQAAAYQYVRHYNAFAQYRISLLKQKFNITPTLFMRKGTYTGFQFDATLLLDYKNIVFAGAGYRNSFGVITMAGVNIFDMFTIAYAFDFTTQKTLRGQVGATHEITAGFHIPSNYKKKTTKAKVEQTQFDVMLADLQRANDSLANRLKYSKQRADSLARALKAVSANANENQSQKTADSLEQVINALFKNQRNTDTSGAKSKAYTLDKIYFEPYKATLLETSDEQLSALLNFMNAFPKAEIFIKGYSDISGSEELNQILSDERAQAVMTYLTGHGIAANRLTAQGFGSQNPVADNNTVEGRKMNRRVEFSVIKK